MIKVSDYVVDYLVAQGIDDIFLVSGGGIMHMLDSVGRHPGVRYICNYQEQASAIAAEAWARLKGRPAACLVTTGPGAANALSGVLGSWFDSVPLIVISGQVRTALIADHRKLRQLGPQELDVVSMARCITKYAVTVRRPESIRRELDRAFLEARSGRPGPVWLDLPLDVQGATLEESRLEETPVPTVQATTNIEDSMDQVLHVLSRARRPLLICGNGIHLAAAEPLVEELLDVFQAPVILPLGGIDLVPESHPLHLGAFGPVGRRCANFALQNSDALLSVGAGLSISAIGFNARGFAPRAKKILVNIDEGELAKGTVVPELVVQADARVFLRALISRLRERPLAVSPRWIEACQNWKRRYPPVAADIHATKGAVNSYAFVDRLSDSLLERDVIVTGNSLDAASVYQAFRVKRGQRVLISMNCGAMGWDLPAAVGASVAHGSGRVVLVTGDGSIQFNIQELETIRHNNLPLKIFVLNNDGYESIRSTQQNFFEGRFVGADRHSGIGNPDFETLSRAYGLTYERIRDNAEIASVLRRVLTAAGPVFCEIMVSSTQGRNPKIVSVRREDGTMESKPLEDMYPFLSPEEVWENMHLFDGDDK